MSATLSWKPVKSAEGTLPDELKFKLRTRFNYPRTFDESDIPFLEGLKACDIKGADTLIKAIRKYEQVEVWEAY